ncbi:hypothetical protein LIA77_05515 [Sarocladium implicatum]|nr:hypothetical protein LIA77_05515 [Sarocladium implicatum]
MGSFGRLRWGGSGPGVGSGAVAGRLDGQTPGSSLDEESAAMWSHVKLLISYLTVTVELVMSIKLRVNRAQTRVKGGQQWVNSDNTRLKNPELHRWKTKRTREGIIPYQLFLARIRGHRIAVRKYEASLCCDKPHYQVFSESPASSDIASELTFGQTIIGHQE